MHQLIIALLLFGQVSAIPLAGSDHDPCVSPTTGKVLCARDEVIVSQGSAGQIFIQTKSPTGAATGPTKTYLPYDRIMVGPDGEACIGTGYFEEGSSRPRPVEGITDTEQGPGNISNLYGNAPPCPAQGRSGAQQAQIETPAMTARRMWEEVALPIPKPHIQPGRAITGKLAYLETNGRTTHTYSNSTVFGQLEIVATGSYTVDWGDGHKTGPHRFEGGPWPDGPITHEYLDVGAYDIVVTENWSATWRLGGETGVLRTLQTTGRIDDFPVEQLQAVIKG